MLRYSSRTHRKLMDESEFALHNAAESERERISRIATTVLDDGKIYQQWEAQHASLLRPVAEHRKNQSQLMELRNAEMQLVHRRALFRLLRRSGLKGSARERLFRTIHSTRDYNDAVLAEHRQYMMAVSSHVSADHIINVMKDVSSRRLLQMYENSYTRYFQMRCYVALAGDTDCVELVRLSMKDTARELQRTRMRIQSETPVTDGGNFDREEALARSGRYPILDYMVG